MNIQHLGFDFKPAFEALEPYFENLLGISHALLRLFCNIQTLLWQPCFSWFFFYYYFIIHFTNQECRT